MEKGRFENLLFNFLISLLISILMYRGGIDGNICTAALIFCSFLLTRTEDLSRNIAKAMKGIMAEAAKEAGSKEGKLEAS